MKAFECSRGGTPQLWVMVLFYYRYDPIVAFKWTMLNFSTLRRACSTGGFLAVMVTVFIRRLPLNDWLYSRNLTKFLISLIFPGSVSWNALPEK